jgi:hypothetical protein
MRVVSRAAQGAHFFTKIRLGLDLDGQARAPEDQHIVLVEERAVR